MIKSCYSRVFVRKSCYGKSFMENHVRRGPPIPIPTLQKSYTYLV